jgi:hypothetical protein
MPAPAVIPLVAAGASLLGQGINAYSQGRQNRKSRQFSREMYDLQKEDSLAFWHMQNDYNSPANQMKRFQEAGLNPNLIYGRGSSGLASPIKTPDVQAAQFRAPQVDLGSVLGSYFDAEIKQAQIDNLRADNTVKLEDAMLRNAQRANIEQNTATGKFDLGLKSELRQVHADAARENLRSIKANTDIALRDDERRAATTSSGLKEAAERIMNMRAQRANTKAEYNRIKAQTNLLRKQATLNALDIELKENFIQPSDPLLLRILSRMVSRNYFDNFFEN